MTTIKLIPKDGFTWDGRDTTMQEGDVERSSSLPPLPVDPTPKDFRVLFVYPNYMFVNLLPTNIGILNACLLQAGFKTGLFDTTFYRTAARSLDEIRVENLQLRKFSLSDFGVHEKPNDYVADFKKKVAEFKPHLIAFTVVEDTWRQAQTLIESVRETGIPVIVGGVFATLAPEVIARHADVDIVCVGEGEWALVELCQRMHAGKEYANVRNLWVRRSDGTVVKNTMRPAIGLDDVPHANWDFFEKERFFRPMQGKIFRMVPIETDRGCPYKCRFCEAPSLVAAYREATGDYYFRRKSWSRVRQELELYIAKYNAEYIYFNAETFLAMSEKDFDEFIAMYSDFKLPFWCQTRIETLTEKRVQKMQEVNCNRISIGLEHGNEDFRKKIVGKGFSNRQLAAAFELLNASSIPITINNILGFPGETRELVFDTIELNRQLGTDSVNAYYFTPYRGTPMRDDCITAGYITEDTETATPTGGSPVLNMPQLTNTEILGLVRTFSLYVKFPKEEWPLIQRAEKTDEEGNRIFGDLSAKYYERFFDHDFKYTKKACFSSEIYNTPKRPTETVTP
jgi:anaerobic magnesium-protoporphyrin IX monomethyl ester cyclase